MNKRSELEKLVSKFTNPTVMKFQPAEDYDEPEEQGGTGLVNRIRNFFSPPSRPQPRAHVQRKQSITNFGDNIAKRTEKEKPRIKFVKKLTSEHVLVGNEDQLDAMSIGGLINQFVDTEYLWSLKIKRAILQVAIDVKKSYILILADGEVFVYIFDSKALHQKPTLLGSVSLVKSVGYIHVLREGIFALCCSDSIEMYTVDQVKGIRLILRKKYDLPAEEQLVLFQIPEPYQNVLNIFFEQFKANQPIFSLWNIMVQFNQKEIKLTKASKIYQIPKFLRPFTRLQNYSKTIYLINLGKDIYAVRKGYVIDFANVNIQAGNNYLRYLSNNKLIHVTDYKAEVYHFSIDETLLPPRIIVNSTDSIEIPALSEKYQYVEAVEILGDNFALFYHLKPSANKLLRGETKYLFIITHMIRMQDKLKNILTQQAGGVQTLEQRADMAKKMGMQRKQIYLRLWNNSNKTEVQDYKLLLDTLDYQTIKIEIEKKMKKTSMGFREVQLLQQGCMSMLHENVFGPNNTKQDIKNYLISNTLIRKLDLYKFITVEEKNEGKAITEDPTGKLLINIQNYNYYKTLDVKSMLFEMINRFCNDDKDEINKIRILIKHFKFPLRIDYQEVLAEIIANTKKKFLKVLSALPELLPYQPPSDSTLDDISLMSGIWSPISEQQWQRHLYIDTVSTLDNRSNLNEICQSVWYKRYWLTQHDFINLSKSEIENIHKVNSSYQTFYWVIEKLFDYVKEYEPIREIIDFIQDNYESMPQHIYGKIFLYRKLFDHFKEHRHVHKVEEMDSFSQFLKLKDDDLFKAMFNFQKVRKGFILREVKPLYQKLSCVQVFNQGLLNYFASEKSKISDIKYILNRLNNQKIQFHEQNKGIYQVLVRGMQLKLRLGSGEDIPIDQVLIYIENIPISHQANIQTDLELMARINEYSERFKKIKLNMTIFDMTKNMDNVIAALVHEEIVRTELLKMRDIERIKSETYRIIQQVQQIKTKIYPNQGHGELTIFTFLTELLQQQELISVVAVLLQDQKINQLFNISQTLIENFVLYSYRWKMTRTPAYRQSASYLRELLNLLPVDNQVREYIESELQLALLLSAEELTVYYPLSGRNEYFTSHELQNIISQMAGQCLLSLDVERVYEYALRIQELGSDGELSEITLHQVYEMVIYRLIDCRLLKEVVGRIKTLMQLQESAVYNFIYPSLLVVKIAPELIEQNRNMLLKCSTHLFRYPLKLLTLVQQVMSIEGTSADYKTLILNYYSSIRYQSLNYSQTNPLLEPGILSILETAQLKRNFILLLRYSLYNLLQQKQQFSSHAEYYIMFVMLVNDPYVLVKYFYSNRYKINIKNFRCFLSYLIREDVFSKINVLEFGKRLFYIVYDAVSNNKNIEQAIEEMSRRPINEPMEMLKIHLPKNELEKKLIISLDRLKQKIKTVNNDIAKRKAKGIYNMDAKVEAIKKRLLNPRSKQGFFEYPFLDSDDAARQDDVVKRDDKLKPPRLDPFDCKFQRDSLLNRSSKNLGLYVSVEKQKQQRSLYYTQKFAKDGIYGSLTIEKSFQRQIHEAIQRHFKRVWEDAMTPRKRLRIGKVESQVFNKVKEEVRRSRSKAIEDITTEERLVIEKEQQQVVKTPTVSIIGNVVQQANILLKILTPEMKITEQTQFKFQELQPYKGNQRFELLLRELIEMAFNNQSLSFMSVLIFVKRLNETFVQARITKQWIDIYMRADALQNKFKLQLPIRNIFTVQGLFLQSEISDTLFHLLLPNIVKNANDQNILKICKVVNLAFKKTELEQQILYFYLLQLLRTYQQSLQAIDTSDEDLKMQKQKFKMIIHKIPTKFLLEKEQTLINVFREQAVRREVVQVFIQSFQNRYDMKAAEVMIDKYVHKVKRAKVK